MTRVALILALLAAPVHAQDAGEQARAAARAIEEAAASLESADRSRDRVAALTRTVRAYEDGLAAMRVGLRAATIRETALSRELQARESEIAQLLGVLGAVGDKAGPRSLAHPQGPRGTVRAGLLLASVTPALEARAADLRADLAEVTELRTLQQQAADHLASGLSGVQQARTALSQAIADRTGLPRRFTDDPVRTAILISATETLDDFADGLSQLTQGQPTAPEEPADLENLRPLPMPVRGTVLRQPGEADAAGVRRPGLVIATQPAALVTAPAAATVRYAGPLLDYGLVVILEPRADLLFVLAGLDAAYVEAGQVLPAGGPVGLMGGSVAADGVSPSGEGGGAPGSETLYMEVREGDEPVDPRRWFATDKG
ncbi:murein hydrolase activator EnvC family protein [Citreimonas salinaria]|uniref:Septal ring factor EnvC, activator of murein hydrolases AmiA and AmiB n=1 Tax=Citreimonas salinaria TaxID=321339 RepID=A0A1H3FK23_9RHOB|nr:peptidoglycan DD-metalloendopeptidase family protein [Citreimonas salinaria]SDX91280.1 Septal ring factor EnvC, activator of murein hydrolases AmiA and AmiB [Citreimonas salinaria]